MLEDELDLTSDVKTTGGKGLHVHVPLRPEEGFDAVRGFARDVAVLLVSRYPDELARHRRGLAAARRRLAAVAASTG